VPQMILQGQLQSKSNSRQIVMVRGKPLVIKSKAARDCADSFTTQLKAQWQNAPPVPEPALLSCVIHYTSRRSDLDVSLLQDCLQAAGVVANDRHIHELRASKRFDKANPRVELWIGPAVVEEHSRAVGEGYFKGGEG